MRYPWGRSVFLDKRCMPIGVIDSGVGGISVLREIKKILPMESYVYLSDIKNAPYGIKSEEEIIELTENAVKTLLLFPCKTIVIACNTATAAAINVLRKKYTDTFIVGIEPAVTPAVKEFPGEDILVLTTEATAKTSRFNNLISVASQKSNVVCLSTQKVVSYVEAEMGDSAALVTYLKSAFSPYRSRHFSAVVLGCTHFPFARRAIEKALGYRTCFYDGAVGAAKMVKRIIDKARLRSGEVCCAEIIWLENGFSDMGRKFIKNNN